MSRESAPPASAPAGREAAPRTIRIAPVRKSIVVETGAAHAFAVFTAGIDRWWPHDKGIGQGPIARSVIEPFAGGRWYTCHADGSEVTVGHVRVWEPDTRLVVGWEISAQWKPDARIELASEVEVRFIAEGPARTRVELEHRDFERMGKTDGESMRGHVDGGWSGMLECFAREAAHAGDAR
jgi:uncharacterized protein YndB with AHSA1/START domain